MRFKGVFISTVLLLIAVCLTCLADSRQQPAPGCMVSQKFDKAVTVKVSCQYLLYLPGDFKARQKWPLILFLHGSKAGGDDIEIVRTMGLPKFLEGKKDFPFVVVCPQCPKNKQWHEQGQVLMSLLDELIEKYPIDSERVYLTGLSKGGFGAWKIGCEYPDRFAAVVPISGWGDVSEACRLKDVPVWAFHGDVDEVIPFEKSKEMVDAIKAYGGNPKFTVCRGQGHDYCKIAYNDPNIFEWLIEQRKTKK